MDFQALGKLEQKISEKDFLGAVKSAANRLGFSFEDDKIFSKDEKYVLKTNKDFKHEWGDGGYDLTEYSLVRLDGEERIVLLLRKYVIWWTTRDDSVDYEDKREEFVALHQDDELGKIAFDMLKEKHR